MNTNWKLNVQFHPFVLKHPGLESEIEKFYQETTAEHEDEIEKLETEKKLSEEEQYDEGYDNGKRDKEETIIRDLRNIDGLEELRAYIGRL